MKLSEIEKLCNEAIPGPWLWYDEDIKEESDIATFDHNDSVTVIHRDSGVYGPDVPTCEFIIAARTLMPKLLKIARAVKGYLAAFEIYDKEPTKEAYFICKSHRDDFSLVLKELEDEV